MFQKHLANLDTLERNDLSSDDLEEYNDSENEDSLETYNEEDEEVKLSKRTSEMKSEELPPLLRNRSTMSHKKKKLNYKNQNENKGPRSVKSIRSNTSKKSKASNMKMSEEFDDLETLMPLKLK